MSETPRANNPARQWAYDLVAKAARGEYQSRSFQPLRWAQEVVAKDMRSAPAIQSPETLAHARAFSQEPDRG